MESVTAWLWGPLSFLLAFWIIRDSPFRHPLQIIVSTGQLYGDVLYYGTCAFDKLVWGVEYARPEGWYFWGYFVFLNAFWVLGPGGEFSFQFFFLWIWIWGWELLVNGL